MCQFDLLNSVSFLDELLINSNHLKGRIKDIDDSTKADSQGDFCCWEGYNSSQKILHCTNRKVIHPWKTLINVCGQEEQVKTGYCFYHQRFCVDESKRHTDQMIRISRPNKYALCTECFILKEGSTTSLLKRIPGIRRKISNECILVATPSSIKIKYDQYQAAHEFQQETEKPCEDLRVQIMAAKRIQLRWREYTLAHKSEIQEYEKSYKENLAALKIQTFVKATKNITLIRNKTAPIITEYKSIQYPSSFQEASDTDSNSSVDWNELTRNISLKETITYPLPQVRRKTRKYNNKNKKCELSLCRLCNNKKSVQRSRIVSNSVVNAQVLLETRRRITSLKPFKQMDPFDVGFISKSKFVDIIQKLWNDSGHHLLPEELKSIICQFSSHDGYINYQNYLQFARRQLLPCSVHSRLVCTSSQCNNISMMSLQEDIQCKNYSSAKFDSKFCKCGEYISNHEMRPKKRALYSRKRGLNIFSAQDMRHTLSRHTTPDMSTSLEFSDIKCCKRLNVENQYDTDPMVSYHHKSLITEM